jgi:hypothetical protein
MNDEDEDLMVTLFFIAFVIVSLFFTGIGIAAFIWSWL